MGIVLGTLMSNRIVQILISLIVLSVVVLLIYLGYKVVSKVRQGIPPESGIPDVICETPAQKQSEQCKALERQRTEMCGDYQLDSAGKPKLDAQGKPVVVVKPNVFKASDGTCKACPDGYVRASFDENGDKACRSVTSPVATANTPTLLKNRTAGIFKGEKAIFQTCSKIFPGSEAATLKPRECWACPAGYRSDNIHTWGDRNSPNDKKCVQSGDVSIRHCPPPEFVGPLTSGLNKCWSCPEGFSENMLVTVPARLGTTSALLFPIRACKNKSVGALADFKGATAYTPNRPTTQSSTSSEGPSENPPSGESFENFFGIKPNGSIAGLY